MSENFDGGEYIDDICLPPQTFDNSKPFTISFWAKSKDSYQHEVFANGFMVVKCKMQSGVWNHISATYAYGKLISLYTNAIFPWYKQIYFWLFPGMKQETEIEISGLTIK